MRTLILMLAMASTAFGQAAKAKKEVKKAEPPPPVALTFFSVSFAEGQMTVTVDSRPSGKSHGDIRVMRGEPLNIPAFGGAEVRRDEVSGGFNVLHDFTTFRDLPKLIATTYGIENLDKMMRIDPEEQVLVLTPEVPIYKGQPAQTSGMKRAYFTYPRYHVGPADFDICLTGMKEGMFHLYYFPFGNGMMTRISFYSSDEPKNPPGTITVSQQQIEGKPQALVTHLREIHTPNLRREYTLPLTMPAQERYGMTIGYIGDLPIAIPKIQTRGVFFPMYGVDFGMKGKYLVINRIMAGSAAEVAGLKEGDLVMRINGGKSLTDTTQAQKLLGETEFGKETLWDVERFGKRKVIRVMPF